MKSSKTLREEMHKIVWNVSSEDERAFITKVVSNLTFDLNAAIKLIREQHEMLKELQWPCEEEDVGYVCFICDGAGSNTNLGEGEHSDACGVAVLLSEAEKFLEGE